MPTLPAEHVQVACITFPDIMYKHKRFTPREFAVIYVSKIEVNFNIVFCCIFFYCKVEEYIATGRDKFTVDPDPNQIYTKRKARECSISLPEYLSQIRYVTEIIYPTSGWDKSLKKLPLFAKVEMNNHIENSGKKMGSVKHHSVPTKLLLAKTFLAVCQDSKFFGRSGCLCRLH